MKSSRRGGVGPEDAAQHYERIRMMAEDDERFTFTGVKDAARIDSYYDPVGNLSIEQRTRLEIARESYKGGRVEAAEGMRTHLLTSAGLSVLQRHQFEADIGERHLVAGTAAEPDPLGADSKRTAHHRVARTGCSLVRLCCALPQPFQRGGRS